MVSAREIKETAQLSLIQGMGIAVGGIVVGIVINRFFKRGQTGGSF